MDKKKILILGASGFVGNAIYKELCSYFDTYGTYYSNRSFANNKQFVRYDMEEDDMEEDDDGLTRTLTYDELQASMLVGNPRTSRTSRNPNWRADLINHGNNAIKIVEYLFRIIDKNGLLSYQKNILEQTLKFGIRKIQCNEPAKYQCIRC